MADIADDANELHEFFLQKKLSKITLTRPAYTGVCMFCGEECGERRFCDSYCREDYEKSRRKR